MHWKQKHTKHKSEDFVQSSSFSAVIEAILENYDVPLNCFIITWFWIMLTSSLINAKFFNQYCEH